MRRRDEYGVWGGRWWLIRLDGYGVWGGEKGGLRRGDGYGV